MIPSKCTVQGCIDTTCVWGLLMVFNSMASNNTQSPGINMWLRGYARNSGWIRPTLKSNFDGLNNLLCLQSKSDGHPTEVLRDFAWHRLKNWLRCSCVYHAHVPLSLGRVGVQKREVNSQSLGNRTPIPCGGPQCRITIMRHASWQKDRMWLDL